MSWLLNFGYVLLLIAATPWLAWAAWRQGKYRQGWSAKLWGRVPRRRGDRPCIWWHAVSVGEVNLLPSMLTPLLQQCDVECVITTTTRTGYELAQRKFPQHLVAYCPLDFSWAVRSALRRLRPDLLVLTELELWPNLIRLADRQGIPVVIVNGRLGEASFRGYRRIRFLMRHVLQRVSWIGAQTETYARRFVQLGADPRRVAVTGSVKFDGAETDCHNARTAELARLAHLAPQDMVFLAGSTQDPEERLALETFQQLLPQFPALRLILVPRHPERFDEVARMLDSTGVLWQRRSQLETARRPDARVLLVDTIGELAAWWGVAQVAFVGGSFGDRGGQNMIEPAAYGAAVSFGPNTWNFRDVVQLLCQGDAAQVVRDGSDLTRFVRRCLEDEPFRRSLGQRSQQLVRQNQGAAARTCEQLVRRLPVAAMCRGTATGDADLPRPRKSA